jgi:PAS domain-containing protein
MPIFDRSIDDITEQHIHDLAGTPEGQTFELKGGLPAENPRARPDAWTSAPLEGQNRRGPEDYAKQGIFRELCAFANAKGGWLVLGMGETEERPKRATAVTPLPACHELADRLRRAADSWLDPLIPGLRVRGIEIGDEPGAGIVLARVPRSPIAPHRLSKAGRTQEAHRRVDDESKPMTMREIQDMTLQRRGEQALMEAMFSEGRASADDASRPSAACRFPSNRGSGGRSACCRGALSAWGAIRPSAGSTLDLDGAGLRLFTGTGGAPWVSAASSVSASLGITIDVYRIGPEEAIKDLDGRWAQLTGLSPEAALLVRPDDFVGWRADTLPQSPADELSKVIRQIFARD